MVPPVSVGEGRSWSGALPGKGEGRLVLPGNHNRARDMEKGAALRDMVHSPGDLPVS